MEAIITTLDEDKYQISMKSNYINIILLEDEINCFNIIFSKKIDNINDWIEKLRTTRSIFLTLYNIKDVTIKLKIKSVKEHIAKTRSLRKKLEFANHFRNKGIGHLDTTLLNRAVQWETFIFLENDKENELLILANSHKAVIESCINSYLNSEGTQKEFGHEIDLAYPGDNQEFYSYLELLVREAVEWLQSSRQILHSQIKFHTKDEVFELAAVAGATNFNLKGDSDLNYCEDYSKKIISKGLEKIAGHDVKQVDIDVLKKKYEI